MIFMAAAAYKTDITMCDATCMECSGLNISTGLQDRGVISVASHHTSLYEKYDK